MQSAQLQIIAQASSGNLAALRFFAVRFSRFLLETSQSGFGQVEPSNGHPSISITNRKQAASHPKPKFELRHYRLPA